MQLKYTESLLGFKHSLDTDQIKNNLAKLVSALVPKTRFVGSVTSMASNLVICRKSL